MSRQRLRDESRSLRDGVAKGKVRKVIIPLLGIVILGLLSFWLVTSGRGRQLIQAATSPRIALALWKECPEGRGQGLRYDQAFWQSHAVYHLACEYAMCGIDTPFAVAVGRTGKETLLSGSEGPREPGTALHEYAQAPLRAFNSISRQEGVQIDEKNIEEYLKFFADAYISWGNVYIPDQATLEEILATPSRLDDDLVQRVSRKPPTFEIQRSEDGSFQAEIYTWWFWIGRVYHLELEVELDGWVSFSTALHGLQPGMNWDVGVPAKDGAQASWQDG